MESLNIVFTGQNQVEVKREEVGPPPPGHVLVQAEKSLISTGTECICLSRNFSPGTHWDNWVKYPFYPGYSSTGRVIEVGEEVEALRVGDRVAVQAGHRQVFQTWEEKCHLIPEGVSDEAATWSELGKIVQNGVRRARHTLGDDVVVIGLGLLGQLVIQNLRLCGARHIIAIDMAPARLEMARAHGATHVLSCRADEAQQAVAQITGGRLADVVYDVTGHPAVFPAALGLARQFGTVLLLGDAGEPSKQCLTSDVITRGVSIVPAHASHPPDQETPTERWTKRNIIELFLLQLSREQMRVDDLITHRFSPLEAAQAYDFLLHDRSEAMGVIFDWSRVD